MGMRFHGDPGKPLGGVLGRPQCGQILAARTVDGAKAAGEVLDACRLERRFACRTHV